MASVPVILVAVDGSGPSMNTIRYLAHVLSPYHIDLELFHVASELPETFFDLGEVEGTAALGAELGEWRRSRSMQMESFLTDAIGVLVDAGFSEETVLDFLSFPADGFGGRIRFIALTNIRIPESVNGRGRIGLGCGGKPPCARR